MKPHNIMQANVVLTMSASSSDTTTTSAEASTSKKTPSSESDPSVPYGMLCETKNLYAGKEDKYRRFQWLDTRPDDLGSPAEDDVTSKFAIVVRHVRVFEDPRRVLRVHSVLVQSPSLKRLLSKVLKDYPGVSTNLTRLEFADRFEPLIHRWLPFKDAINSEEDEVTKQHAQLLENVLEREFKDVLSESSDMISKGVITFEHIWIVFQPGMTIITLQDEQETALELRASRYGVDENKTRVLLLECQMIEWDGTRFGRKNYSCLLPEYTGTKEIKKLEAFPLAYHPEEDELKARLIERGSMVESLCGEAHYKFFEGVGWNTNYKGFKQKHHVKGRIMVDGASFNTFKPDQAVVLSNSSRHDYSSPRGYLPSRRGNHRLYPRTRSPVPLPPMPLDFYDDNGYGGGSYASKDDLPVDERSDDAKQAPKQDAKSLSDDEKLICTYLLRGYALSAKLWLNFPVDGIRDIDFSERAFESLVLPQGQKQLLLSFIESQRQDAPNTFDDVVEGKGKGIIMLLCGPPGVGKTLTAEASAEKLRAPLYSMTSGDIGYTTHEVEEQLTDILEMCKTWKAILLIDEADVFLEERSLHDLHRNQLVSIFLRLLEYYEGILFLTTNRLRSFDPAFHSRIHISIDYKELDKPSRMKVWKNFLSAAVTTAAVENSITEAQMHKLAAKELNGRQIKNIVKTAQLLAQSKQRKLEFQDMQVILDNTQHLHDSTQATNEGRSALFA